MAFGRRDPTPLEKRLGYRFKRLDLLELALTHRSWANEQGIPEHYERLEFLGDAVLGVVTAEWLYANHPELPEGELSKHKAQLVNRDTLAQHALVPGARGLAAHRGGGGPLGRAHQALPARGLHGGGLRRPLPRRRAGDGAARSILPMLENAFMERSRQAVTDAKTQLQEVVQALGWPLPEYRVTDSVGPGPRQDLRRRMLAGGRARRPWRGAEQEDRRAAGRHRRPRPAAGEVEYNPAPMSQAISHTRLTTIRELTRNVGQTVELRGWIDNKRSSGKIAFLQVRVTGGTVQAVAGRKDVSEKDWEDIERATQESTVRVTGIVKEDKRSPSGVEIQCSGFELLYLTPDYPITPKEHGTAFLMEHRHLWLRSSRQRSALRVRSEVEQAIRDFFYEREFTLIDSPILTPAACEGTSTLFETDYFGDKAYLSQSGQLYLEPAAAALGKVYCFGPTFRAEKSKTRRHLMEFWMVEPEVAFLEFEGLCALAEEFVGYLVARVLDRCPRGAEDPRARHGEARGGGAAVPAHHLHRGGQDPQRQGEPHPVGRRLRRRRGDAPRQPATTGR